EWPHHLTAIQVYRGSQYLTVLANTYDTATGRLISSVDARGNSTHVQHDLASRREVVTDASGNTTTHEYDTRGNVLRTINPVGQIITRTFDDRNNVLSETDSLGHTSV